MQSANMNKNKQKRIDVHRQLNDKYRLNKIQNKDQSP